MTAVRYHQMLVSPHVGGGAKLAFEIHRHASGVRPGASQLLVPGGAEAERTVTAERFAFTRYRVDRLTGTSRSQSLLENARLWMAMVRYSPGVVHIHAPFVYGAARPFLRMTGLKTVLHIHLDFEVEQLQWALRSPPDLIVVCAEFMRGAVVEALGMNGHRKTNVQVIRNAVDVQRFTPDAAGNSRQRLGLPAGVPVLMMIANLAPHKGQETALRAVARLNAMGHVTKLMLVGAERSDGKGFEAKLRNLSRELQIEEQVDFAGFRQDIPELLAAADFVLLPSTSEGLPLVILEAQAAGAVVLAAPTAGIPEVVHHGRTGFLVPATDDEGYAANIARLLDDRQEAAAVRSAAQINVRQNHDMPAYCSRIIGEYDRLLAGS